MRARFVYNWHLDKQGGQCQYGARLGPDLAKPPWRSGSQTLGKRDVGKPTLSGVLQNLKAILPDSKTTQVCQRVDEVAATVVMHVPPHKAHAAVQQDAQEKRQQMEKLAGCSEDAPR